MRHFDKIIYNYMTLFQKCTMVYKLNINSHKGMFPKKII